jgi:hypothetical protein
MVELVIGVFSHRRDAFLQHLSLKPSDLEELKSSTELSSEYSTFAAINFSKHGAHKSLEKIIVNDVKCVKLIYTISDSAMRF